MKKKFHWGHLLQFGANVLVEFENVFFLIEGIFYNWGRLGANVLVEFEKKNFNGGIFLLLGANVLVEFENVF